MALRDKAGLLRPPGADGSRAFASNADGNRKGRLKPSASARPSLPLVKAGPNNGDALFFNTLIGNT